MKKVKSAVKPSAASQLIDARIQGLGDWRGALLTRLRKCIHDAAPDLAEEWKWNTPVWSHNGSVVAVGAFKDHVKVNFFKGAQLADPDGLFNAGLDAKTSRAIDIQAAGGLNEGAFKKLVRNAAALDTTTKKPR